MKVLIRVHRPQGGRFKEDGLVYRDTDNTFKLIDGKAPVEYVRVKNIRPTVLFGMLTSGMKNKLKGTGAPKAKVELLILQRLLDMAIEADKLTEEDILIPKTTGGFELIKKETICPTSQSAQTLSAPQE